VGADLREGKRTLPLIAMLARASLAEQERIWTLLRRSSLNLDEIEEIRILVVEHAGVEYALERAHEYARAAKRDLIEAFPPSEEREILGLIADFVVDRDR